MVGMCSRSALLTDIRRVRGVVATAAESPAADLHHLKHAEDIEADLDRLVATLARPDDATPPPRATRAP